MSGLKRDLRETATHYGEYAERLLQWTTAAADVVEVDAALADLSGMETLFIEGAKQIGERVDAVRTQRAKRNRVQTTIHDLALAEGCLAEFEDAANAVAEVSRRRVEALRAVERIKDGIGKEREKISRAKKVNKMYTRPRESGRRLNGQA